jgi:hypothetical protein
MVDFCTTVINPKARTLTTLGYTLSTVEIRNGNDGGQNYERRCQRMMYLLFSFLMISSNGNAARLRLPLGFHSNLFQYSANG